MIREPPKISSPRHRLLFSLGPTGTVTLSLPRVQNEGREHAMWNATQASLTWNEGLKVSVDEEKIQVENIFKEIYPYRF